MNTAKNIAVIGGGASGMLAALTAAENKNCHVLLFERQSRVGKKLLATGNGRCNLTNTEAVPVRKTCTGKAVDALKVCSVPSHYHGNSPVFAVPALDAFPPESVLSYFRGLGLVCTTQYGGRVYPLSDSAGSVLDVLRFALDSAGVVQYTGEQVTGIERKGERFLLRTERTEPDSSNDKDGSNGKSRNGKCRICSSTYTVDKVIIACGGLAGGKNGGCSDGYSLLKALGHRCTKLYPALVPVWTDTDYPRSLKGVRADAELRLYSSPVHDPDGRNVVYNVNNMDSADNIVHNSPVAVGSGELQFVERGVSGPAAFDISREASIHGGTLIIDFLRELSGEDALALLRARQARSPELDLSALFAGVLHSRLGIVIVKVAGFRPSSLIRDLSDSDLQSIIDTAKNFKLHVTGTDSFDAAQVTVGGIDTGEFDPRTLESRLVPGLYACGEVLDIDADCGGFNLQWAWASGRLAGQLSSSGNSPVK